MINDKSPRPQRQGDIKEWWGLWQTKARVPCQERIDAALRQLTIAHEHTELLIF